MRTTTPTSRFAGITSSSAGAPIRRTRSRSATSRWLDARTSLPPDVLELHEAEGAFERLEEWLRARGFFEPGGEALVADLYLGYGLSRAIRRGRTPPPPEPCRLPLVACVVRSDNYADARDDVESRSPRSASGSERGRRPTTRRPSSRCERPSPAVTSTRSTSSSISRRRSPATPARSPPGSAR